jgi:hypothetical protein
MHFMHRSSLAPASTLARVAALATSVLLVGAGPASARDNDFPTIDRVLYVQECVRSHPGGHYEMVNKCACALDRVAAEVSFDDYVQMNTAANATSIGGERGGYIRENEPMQDLVKRYRALQTRVKKACFVIP